MVGPLGGGAGLATSGWPLAWQGVMRRPVPSVALSRPVSGMAHFIAELYPKVVDGVEKKGGVGRQEGTP